MWVRGAARRSVIIYSPPCTQALLANERSADVQVFPSNPAHLLQRPQRRPRCQDAALQVLLRLVHRHWAGAAMHTEKRPALQSTGRQPERHTKLVWSRAQAAWSDPKERPRGACNCCSPAAVHPMWQPVEEQQDLQRGLSSTRCSAARGRLRLHLRTRRAFRALLCGSRYAVRISTAAAGSLLVSTSRWLLRIIAVWRCCWLQWGLDRALRALLAGFCSASWRGALGLLLLLVAIERVCCCLDAGTR